MNRKHRNLHVIEKAQNIPQDDDFYSLIPAQHNSLPIPWYVLT